MKKALSLLLLTVLFSFIVCPMVQANSNAHWEPDYIDMVMCGEEIYKDVTILAQYYSTTRFIIFIGKKTGFKAGRYKIKCVGDYHILSSREADIKKDNN